MIAFSLATGDRLRLMSVSQGEGPGELNGLGGAVLAPEGGIYLWRYPKALLLDGRGIVVDEWRPDVPEVWADLCILGGRPAVAVRSGLVRRGVDGSDDRIGWTSSGRGSQRVETVDEAVAVIGEPMKTRLACRGDLAFVLPGRAAPADSVFVYSIDRLERKLAIPGELIEEAVGFAFGRLDVLADDGRGNIVLLGADPFAEVPGAVMDPRSGCHALLRNPRPQLFRQFVGVYADSAVVFHWDHEEETSGGERVVHLRDRANRISVHPLEPLRGGEPCADILPTLR